MIKRIGNYKDSSKGIFFLLLQLMVLFYLMDISYNYGYDSVNLLPESKVLIHGGEAVQVLPKKKLDEIPPDQPDAPEFHFMKNIEQISWEPRAQIYHNFFTQEECDTLVKLVEPKLERSQVVDPNHPGKSKVSSARTSSGYWFRRNEHPILEKATKQIEEWTRLPEKNGEQFYALRYSIGEQYLPHSDYFGAKQNLGSAGNRIATVLVYLHSPEEGGETFFPNSPSKARCNATAGDALLFWDYLPQVEPDPLSIHGGGPVVKGVKWSMTRWIRMRPYS